MITSPHLATMLFFDVLRRWSLYLNRCMTASSSEDVGAPGSMVPFPAEPILFELEGGRYVGPLLTSTMANMVSGRRSVGGSGSGGGNGGGNAVGNGGAGWCGAGAGTGVLGGAARVWVCYEEHLPDLFVQGGENLRTILEGKVLPMVQGHVLCKNWHPCRLSWGDCAGRNVSVKTCTFPPPPMWWQPSPRC